MKRRSLSSFSFLACGIALIGAPKIAFAQAIAPVVTAHTIKHGQGPLFYRATFIEKVLTDAVNTPQATLSAIAYLRSDVGVKETAKRPVLFLFNGGPCASSSLLQFSAFGPRILGKGQKATLEDNPDTLLDAADLVFIDPPGTGLSRVLKPKGLNRFLGPNADTTAVLSLMNDWLKTNHREQSPVYIAGESYGGTRAALIAGRLADQKFNINLKGLLLISPALDYSLLGLGEDSDTSRVMHFSTMAAGAWYYNKINRQGRSLPAFVAAAQTFADKEYAPALLGGKQLGQTKRDQIAEKMASFTGVNKTDILRSNLRLDSAYYLATLNSTKKLTTGQLDMRVTAPQASLFDASSRPIAGDPTLGLGDSSTIVSPTITDYFHNELKVPGTENYVSLSLKLNSRWNWLDIGKDKYVGSPKFMQFNVTPDLTRLMKQKPDLKLMVVGGYYDLTVPISAVRTALDHANIPPQRVQFTAFPTGHTVFNTSDDLAGKMALVRSFFKLN